ncbi:TetR family transcriptional regulator [Rhodococcus sp. WMMA185]|uniref:TetR/AcrR family transcriptional regulator n=1 Tax=Rhodococcus sp. WMMA185 TaxID=679318 RepID=UPI000878AFD3|nr:TetR family transcriptional regulator [Rhodococcus sp. WMMA185]AOW93507.1 TetR family transcriptional regulator [Rhodococcus sp. WMMA185]
MAAGRRSGRRPGKQDTRDQILSAARLAFAQHGYGGTTVRSVAASAGVDAALVYHYFGTKEKLFVAMMDAPIDPRQYVDTIVDGPVDRLAERILRTALEVWDSPAGPAAMALVRSSIAHERSARLLREFLLERAMRPIVESVETDPEMAQWRANLVGAQLIGLVTMRYLLALEPLASATPERVVELVAPNLQRYLTGELRTEARTLNT